MKVYIATAFGNFKQAEIAKRLLQELGHKCTARWIAVAKELNGNDAATVDPDLRKREAEKCLEDIDNLDTLLLLVPPEGGCGMWIELGYTLGLRGLYRPPRSCTHRILAVGHAKERTLFCELFQVDVYDSLEDAINAL